MLSVFETGEASFRLSDRHDEDVGWIRGAALGFDGFGSEADAIAAAVAGSQALAGYLDRLSGATQPSGRTTGRVRLVHDGAYEWVSRGSTPLARLYRPERDLPQRSRRRTFAVEFVLPSYVKSGSAISASQVLYHAIGHSMEAASARGGASTAPASAPAGVDGVAVG